VVAATVPRHRSQVGFRRLTQVESAAASRPRLILE
jgi:hypothetical protein